MPVAAWEIADINGRITLWQHTIIWGGIICHDKRSELHDWYREVGFPDVKNNLQGVHKVPKFAGLSCNPYLSALDFWKFESEKSSLMNLIFGLVWTVFVDCKIHVQNR